MLARMRTIAEAIAAIRDADPQTAFTQTALRRMIKTGEVPSVRVGTKYLVNLDTLIDYLNNPITRPPEFLTVNGVRPIPEKLNRKTYN